MTWSLSSEGDSSSGRNKKPTARKMGVVSDEAQDCEPTQMDPTPSAPHQGLGGKSLLKKEMAKLRPEG